MSRRRLGLTMDQQRKLARLAERPDAPLAMKLRVRLLNRLDENFEFLWQCVMAQLVFASKDTEPSTRLLISLLDRLLPVQREMVSFTHSESTVDERSRTSTPIIINVRNVNRGTKEARANAVEISAQKRAAIELPPAA